MIDPDAEEIVARDDPEPSPETATRPSQEGAETVPDGAQIIEPRRHPAGLTIYFKDLDGKSDGRCAAR